MELDGYIVLFIMIATAAFALLFYLFVQQGKEIKKTYEEEKTMPGPRPTPIKMRSGEVDKKVCIYRYYPMGGRRICTFCEGENRVDAGVCCVCGQPMR